MYRATSKDTAWILIGLLRSERYCFISLGTNPGQFLSGSLGRSRIQHVTAPRSLIRTSLDKGDTVSVINWILNPPSSEIYVLKCSLCSSEAK